jgi:LCP family protein required for cell wall assembly
LKKKKTLILILIAIALLLILAVAIHSCTLLGKINIKELPESDEELGICKVPEKNYGDNYTGSDDLEKNSGGTKITNIALFGLDRRNPDESCRSDTIIILSLDGKNEKIKITSLMRDMYISIPGREETRINHAYSYGGALLAIKTINTNFELDIRDYITVDFNGLAKVIDQIGGIEVDIKDYEISEIEGVTKSGLQKLSGDQTVMYARIRHKGNADYERTERQRNVLSILYRKISSQGITKLPGTVSALLPYVETSLSKTQIMNFVMEAAGYKTEDLEQFRLPVDEHFKIQTIRGMYVLVPELEENKELLKEFIYGVQPFSEE